MNKSRFQTAAHRRGDAQKRIKIVVSFIFISAGLQSMRLDGGPYVEHAVRIGAGSWLLSGSVWGDGIPEGNPEALWKSYPDQAFSLVVSLQGGSVEEYTRIQVDFAVCPPVRRSRCKAREARGVISSVGPLSLCFRIRG